MVRRKNPVLQRYQVELRGHQYYVLDTKTRATVGGPYKKRTSAQDKADQMERRSGG
jgi:hypothetical protein